MDLNIIMPLDQNALKANALIEEMDRLWEEKQIDGQTISLRLGELEIVLNLNEKTFDAVYNALLEIRNKA